MLSYSDKQCIHCGSTAIKPKSHEFTYADLDGLDFYSVVTVDCRSCSKQSEIIYRCHYFLTQDMRDQITDGYHSGDGLCIDDRCPSCGSPHTTICNGDFRFDVEHLSGIHSTWRCWDCNHIFEVHSPCRYAITRGRSNFVKARVEHFYEDHSKGICTECSYHTYQPLELLVPDTHGRCPQCGNNGVHPRSDGTYRHMDGENGLFLEVECYKCHHFFVDVYVWEYVTTRDVMDEYCDSEGRRICDVEEYWCERCFMKWTDIDGSRGDECPLCGSGNPYPVNQD